MRLIAACMLRDWRMTRTRRPAIALDLLAVVMSAVVFYYLATFVDHGAGYFPFVIAGITVLRVHAAVPKVLAATTARIADGSLEILLTGRSRAATVLAGEAAFEVLRGVIMSALLILVATLVLGADVTITLPGLLAIVVGLAGAGAVLLALTMVLLALLMLLREAGAFASLSGVLLPIAAGVYFPRSILPTPLREIAGALPFHCPVDVIRGGLVDGVFPTDDVAILAVAAALSLSLGAIVAGPAVARARHVGRLALE